MLKRSRSLMKFTVEKPTEGHARLGHLELTRHDGSSVSIPTPNFFLHTKAGSIPHITHEVLQKIFPERTPPVQISVDSTFVFQEPVAESNLGIAKFVGLEEYPTILTLLDPLKTFQSGYNDRTGISIWPRFGRRVISIETLSKIISSFKPSVFQCPSDYDVTSKTMDKRLTKSIVRSVEYLDQVISKFPKQESEVMATIEPSWFKVSPNEAEKGLKLILERKSSIGGFILRRNEDELMDFTDLCTLVTDKLPEDKVKYAAGALSLLEIVDLVGQGVDMFDSSVITELCEEKRAMVLPNFEEVSGLKVQEDLANGSCDENGKQLQIFNLNEKRFFDDFKPLSSHCKCYTCRKFTRSYIHHLDVTRELLGPVLLMIHNLHSFDQFFQAIRNGINLDKLKLQLEICNDA